MPLVSHKLILYLFTQSYCVSVPCLCLVIRAPFAGAAECMIGDRSSFAESFVLTDLTHASQDNICCIHVCCASN